MLMQEFMAMGTYLKLTERDMMLLIFKDILSHGIHLARHGTWNSPPRHSPGIARHGIHLE